MARTADSGQAVQSVLRKSLLLVLIALALLRWFPITSMRKTDFNQIELSACSSWADGRGKYDCIVADTSKPTAAGLLTKNDHETLYFGLILHRRFSRAHIGTRHYRLVFKGAFTIDGGTPVPFESGLETDAEGWTDDWKTSFPRRIVWAKNLRKAQTVNLTLDFVKVYTERKISEYADDFSKLGIVQFTIVAESDTNWLMRSINSIKLWGFISVLPMVLLFLVSAECHPHPDFRSIGLLALGVAFLAANNPFQSEQTVPEEYFSNQAQVMLNFVFITMMEIMMGLQIIIETFPGNSTAKKCLIPLICTGYLIGTYARHVHIADFQDAANAYSDGEARVFRQIYFKAHAAKACLISSVPCVLIGLLAPIFRRRFSLAPAFLSYMALSFTQERFVFAVCSIWKFSSDLVIWGLAYLYLTTWKAKKESSITSLPYRTDSEEERSPIYGTK